MLTQMPLYTVRDIETQIENGTAKKINSACFINGVESNVRNDFFMLWGEVIRRQYYDSAYKFHFVKGEAKDIFLATYA